VTEEITVSTTTTGEDTAGKTIKTYSPCSICGQSYPGTNPEDTPHNPTWPTIKWDANDCGANPAAGDGTTATFTAGAASSSANSSSVVFSEDAAGYCSECGDLSATIDPTTTNFTVVGVKSVASGGVTSTTDTPGADETLYVAKGDAGATITITADPDPDAVGWSASTPVWTGATGSGATATFPIDVASSTVDGTTVTAACGTSAKAMKIVVVEVASIDVWDSDKRHAVKDALQVVPPKGSEDISGLAAITPDKALAPTNFPSWIYSGIKKEGLNVNFAKGAAGWSSRDKILMNTAPKSSTVVCEKKEVTVSIYPYDIGTINVDLGMYTSIANSIMDALTVLIPQDITIEGTDLKFDVENQWKEQKDTNLCGWTFNTDIQIDPLLNVDANFGLTAKAITKIEKAIEDYFKKNETVKKFFDKYVADITLPKIKIGVSQKMGYNAEFKMDEYSAVSAKGNFSSSDAKIKGKAILGLELFPGAEEELPKIKIKGNVEITGGWMIGGKPYIDTKKFGQTINAQIKPIIITASCAIKFFKIINIEGEIDPITLLEGIRIDDKKMFEYKWGA
jgi:hypothetical protein